MEINHPFHQVLPAAETNGTSQFNPKALPHMWLDGATFLSRFGKHWEKWRVLLVSNLKFKELLKQLCGVCGLLKRNHIKIKYSNFLVAIKFGIWARAPTFKLLMLFFSINIDGPSYHVISLPINSNGYLLDLILIAELTSRR